MENKDEKRWPSLSEDEISFLNSLGDFIRYNLDHKFEKKKSVEWLAFQIGVSRPSIMAIIKKKSNPTIVTAIRISKGLGYSSFTEFIKDVSSFNK